MTLHFDEMLSLIEDRSAVLRSAAAAVPAAAQVPGCPDWQVSDLVTHLGEVHRFWAAIVAAGPATKPPAEGTIPGRTPTGDLLAWSADCTADLLAALRQAGPDTDCWTWWTESSSPETSGSVARHQVHEAAVHARDAQEAAGHAEPLPEVIATDGVAEFLTTCLGACGPWEHTPALISLQATEGPSWLLDLSDKGAVVIPGEPAGTPPAATVTGTASDLVLVLYSRIGLDALQLSGDRGVVEQMINWGPTD